MSGLYLGAAGTRRQAIEWTKEMMPNLPDAIVTEIADLSDASKIMVRDPRLLKRIDANDEAAPRIRSIVEQYNTDPASVT
tara:strand:+ start:432 stop:671 length:240 start_codon:yes stop_codon:yes gene_type:complete